MWDEPGSYVETDATFTQNRSYEWNHGLGEVVTALTYTLQAVRTGQVPQR